MAGSQEDAGDMEDLEDSDRHPNVSITICPYLDASHPFADTNGPMAALVSKISPSVTGDGGTHQGSQVFHLQQCHGGKML